MIKRIKLKFKRRVKRIVHQLTTEHHRSGGPGPWQADKCEILRTKLNEGRIIHIPLPCFSEKKSLDSLTWWCRSTQKSSHRPWMSCVDVCAADGAWMNWECSYYQQQGWRWWRRRRRALQSYWRGMEKVLRTGEHRVLDISNQWTCFRNADHKMIPSRFFYLICKKLTINYNNSIVIRLINLTSQCFKE